MRRNTTIAIIVLMIALIGATFLQLVVMAPK